MSQRTARETRSGIATYGIAGDENTGLHSPSTDRVQLLAGGVPLVDSANPPRLTARLAVVGEASSSGVFASMANPFGRNVLITRAILFIATQSSGASTVDIGVAADATTSNDGLIDGLSGATAGGYDNTGNGGTNGRKAQSWGTSQFLNVAEASGDVSALVATLHIEAVVT